MRIQFSRRKTIKIWLRWNDKSLISIIRLGLILDLSYIIETEFEFDLELAEADIKSKFI